MTRTDALAALRTIARPRYGVFTNDDARAAGVSAAMLTYHTTHGRFRRLASGIYVLGDEQDWRQPLMGAQLWGGPPTVLAGRSAAVLLGLDGVSRTAPPELYTPRWRHHPTWTVHRGLPPAGHITGRGPFRFTDGLQTLIDLTKSADLDQLEIVSESALRADVVTEDDLRAASKLTALANRRPDGAPPTQSELETRMVQILRTTNLPPPIRQHPVVLSPSWTVYLDLAFPNACLFIETDGRAFHQGTSILRDRHRQNAIVRELGWIPLRFGWADVVERPRHTAREVERCYHQARQRITTAAAGARAPARR